MACTSLGLGTRPTRGVYKFRSGNQHVACTSLGLGTRPTRGVYKFRSGKETNTWRIHATKIVLEEWRKS